MLQKQDLVPSTVVPSLRICGAVPPPFLLSHRVLLLPHRSAVNVLVKARLRLRTRLYTHLPMKRVSC